MIYYMSGPLHFNRVQEDLCFLEDGQLAVVQNIPHRHDHIPGKKHVFNSLYRIKLNFIGSCEKM